MRTHTTQCYRNGDKANGQYKEEITGKADMEKEVPTDDD
jgi:hypothetical protein